MLRTVEAIVNEQGQVRLLERVSLPEARRALVTILKEVPRMDVSEMALLSEPALAHDWKRPATVLADAGQSDGVVCQVTNNPCCNARAMMISDESFQQGGLQWTSYARPAKLFTANHEIIVTAVGMLTESRHAAGAYTATHARSGVRYIERYKDGS